MNAALPMLALSNWGLAVAILFIMLMLGFVAYIILQGTRTQMAWRERVEHGDIDAIQMLVADEIQHWKTMRMPKGVEPAVWRGVQTAELVEVSPTSVRLGAAAEGAYVQTAGERREVHSALSEGMKVTARLADMFFYDIPNVRLPAVQIDVYSTFRNEHGATQRCILSTSCERSVASAIDWDEMPAEDIVRAFGGRYLLDDRGNPLPIDVNEPAKNSVPAAFYRDD
jgi:hypothetical protein